MDMTRILPKEPTQIPPQNRREDMRREIDPPIGGAGRWRSGTPKNNEGFWRRFNGIEWDFNGM